MKKYVVILILFFVGLAASGQQGVVSAKLNDVPVPTQAQLNWHDTERIMFVHWGMATWQNREYDNHTTNPDNVRPMLYSTDQWCETAKAWGAKMIIFVAKHTGGFCWWQTNTSDYGVKELKWNNGQTDVMADLSASCRKYGLKLGVYIYPGDDKWGAGIGSGGICSDPSLQEAYNKIFRQQLTEVLSNYGKISEVWFDGNCKIEVKDILETYAPDAVVFQGYQASLRWVGNEDGTAPYPNWYTLSSRDLRSGSATALASDINGDAYAPVEIDVPLLKHGGHKWFWAKDSDSLLLTVPELMNLYYNSVGRGSVLLLNSTPDTNGLIPASHYAVYKAFGEEISRRFDKPLAKTHFKGLKKRLNFTQPTVVNHVVISEDLKRGQNVLAYTVKGLKDGKWVTLCKGSSVGSKRIEFFKDIEVNSLELEITSYKNIPLIREFSAFNVKTAYGDLTNRNAELQPVQVGYWDKDSYSSQDFREVEIDLTDYINSIGQYVLSFEQLSMDYASGKSSQLEFKDVALEIYGKKNNDFIKQINPSQFLITHSQQTLKDFPVRFKVKVKRGQANSVGQITVRKFIFN